MFAAAVLAVAAALMLGLWHFTRPQTQEGAKTVVVEVVHKDGSARKFSLNTDADSLGKALVEGGVVVESGPSRQMFDSPREERTRAFLQTGV